MEEGPRRSLELRKKKPAALAALGDPPASAGKITEQMIVTYINYGNIVVATDNANVRGLKMDSNAKDTSGSEPSADVNVSGEARANNLAVERGNLKARVHDKARLANVSVGVKGKPAKESGFKWWLEKGLFPLLGILATGAVTYGIWRLTH